MGAGWCIAVYAGAVGRLNSLMVNADSGRETGAGQCIAVQVFLAGLQLA